MEPFLNNNSKLFFQQLFSLNCFPELPLFLMKVLWSTLLKLNLSSYDCLFVQALDGNALITKIPLVIFYQSIYFQ